MSKLAVVTGGTRGLGAAISLEFVGRGYDVVALHRGEESGPARLKAATPGQSTTIRCIVYEVGGPAPFPQINFADYTEIAVVLSAFPGFEPTPFHLIQRSELEDMLRVSALGNWDVIQACLRPLLKAEKKTIVGVLSSAVAGPVPKGFAAYAAAKFAMQGILRGLATEYGSRGLRVMTVSPGMMDTPLTAKWDERMRAMVGGSDVRLRPEDVAAQTVAWVESADSLGKGEDYPIPRSPA